MLMALNEVGRVRVGKDSEQARYPLLYGLSQTYVQYTPDKVSGSPDVGLVHYGG